MPSRRASEGRELRRRAPARSLSLVLAVLLAACAAPRQDLSVWPDELRIRGALLFLGEDAGGEAAYGRFLELAGGEDARIVLVALNGASGAAVEEARTAWADGAASVSLVRETSAADRNGGPDLDAGALDDATGVWVAGASAGPGALDRLVPALRAVVERGGVVAAPGAQGARLAGAALAAEDGAVVAGAGLIPGVLIHPAFDGARARERLLADLEAHPRLFGVGLPSGAALEVNGRRLRALAGEVILLVPAGMTRPLREDTLRAGANGRGNLADLTAWRRDAIERTLDPFPSPNPAPPRVERGTLVIVGGGGIPPEIMDAFIEAAGGPEARLVFVPPSEEDEIDSEPGIVRSWAAAGVASATWIHTKDRRRADGDEAFLAPLRDATGIWFGGGRQWNFSDSYYGTATHQLMHEVLARGGVIGGTSAGASIQADYMARGDPLGNQNIMAPGYERGLGFITGVAIDQHFTERSRQPNLEELVATYPQLLGIGIDEGTALIVQGSVAEVVGRGRVFFYDRTDDAEAKPVILPAGGAYDLVERRVVRAPE